MFKVYAIDKRTRQRAKLVYDATTKDAAVKFCESWGWNYDDGHKSYWLEYIEE